jgi:starvation-inducible DNA-binding protein
MEALEEKMKVVLADTFAMYLKAHMFHWNVTGPNFNELHAFFGGIYEELWAAVDLIAEQIRTLDAYAPGSFERFGQLATVKDELSSAMAMISRLKDDNDKVMESLKAAFLEAEKEKVYGLANFLQDRIDIHAKHGWMLKATMKV